MTNRQSVAAWFGSPSNLVASTLVIGGLLLIAISVFLFFFFGWEVIFKVRPFKSGLETIVLFLGALVVGGVGMLAGRREPSAEVAEVEA